jgi:hypothetical protein
MEPAMTRDQAVPYVAYVVDDAGAGRKLGADQHAIVRESGEQFKYSSKLVGWQCGFEPLFVAVHSYLDVAIADDDAIDMATEYLQEIGWFADSAADDDAKPNPADYVIA